jgi:hypothetical protein
MFAESGSRWPGLDFGQLCLQHPYPDGLDPALDTGMFAAFGSRWPGLDFGQLCLQHPDPDGLDPALDTGMFAVSGSQWPVRCLANMCIQNTGFHDRICWVSQDFECRSKLGNPVSNKIGSLQVILAISAIFECRLYR